MAPPRTAPAPSAPAERGPLSAQSTWPLDGVPATTLRELAGAVEDLAGQFDLRPLLERILRRAVDLLGASAGSVCTVDERAGTYRKEADLGVACRQGMVFPLDEGTTGAVVAARAPVVFDRYADVPGGHLTPSDRERMLATLAVPIVWAGQIIGSCVVFTSDPAKRWTGDDVAVLQLFAGHAAVALANAELHEVTAAGERRQAAQVGRERAVRDVHDVLVGTLGGALQSLHRLSSEAPDHAARTQLLGVAADLAGALAATRGVLLAEDPVPHLADVARRELTWLRASAGVATDLVVTGDPGGVHPEIAAAARSALAEVLANVAQHAGASNVRVGLLCPPRGTTLLVIDDGRGFDVRAAAIRGLDRAVDVVERIGGTLAVETAEQFGTRVRIDLPAGPRPTRPDRTRPVRVLVADPRPVIAAGLAGLVGSGQPDLDVVRSTGSDLATAVRGVDVAVVGDEPELVEALLAAAPGLPVVVVGTADGARLPPALVHRAHGVLAADVSSSELVRVVGVVAAGGTVHPAGLTVTRSDPLAELTAREREVVELVLRGLPDRLVAQQLCISAKTVEKHVGSALRKTGQPNRTALAGLVPRR